MSSCGLLLDSLQDVSQFRFRRFFSFPFRQGLRSGPAEDYPKTYAALHAGVAAKGYKPAGPAIEVYSTKPGVEQGKTILFAKVMVPVKRRA